MATIDVQRITLVRHGEAKYSQLESTLEEADDLTPNGIQVVTGNFHNIGRQYSANSSLALVSSPLARTLQTARIAKTILGGYVKAPISFEVNPELQEVHNFEWELFFPLVNGGEVEYKGRKFLVDKNLTNPNNIVPGNYFNEDLAHKLSEKARARLPIPYLERIAEFEKAVDVEKRVRRVIGEIGKSRKAEDIFVFSHDGLIGFFVGDYTNGQSKTIKPGNYAILEKREGIFKPIFVKD
jgi:broad specificity phosphatase PhoE